MTDLFSQHEKYKRLANTLYNLASELHERIQKRKTIRASWSWGKLTKELKDEDINYMIVFQHIKGYPPYIYLRIVQAMVYNSNLSYVASCLKSNCAAGEEMGYGEKYLEDGVWALEMIENLGTNGVGGQVLDSIY